MDRTVWGFIGWAIVGVVIIVIGIRAFFSKKVVGFWANAEPIKVKDVKKYNYATGKLLIAYGVIFIALGLPLLSGQNSPVILLSVVGVMIETVVTMIIFSLGIEEKYKE